MSLKWVTLPLLSTFALHAQTYEDLRLSEARSVTVTVHTVDGRPVADADIDHLDELAPLGGRTDSTGRLSRETRAPAFVVRKVGYQSQLVRTQSETEFKVTLQPAALKPAISKCPAKRSCETVVGFRASFCFQMTEGVEPLQQANDSHYGVRSYIFSAAVGQSRIMHGSGPFWSYGTPSDLDVWRSVEYKETVYARRDPALSRAGMVIRDALGTTAAGKRWRYLGMFGESASYSKLDEEDARPLDRVLDSVCVVTPH